MRILFLMILLFLVSCAQLSRKPSSELKIRHVVFDIDWTISSEVKPESKGPRIVEIEGKKYYIQDGIEEFIEELLRHDNVKISFFSGGGYSRNHQLLNLVKLNNGRSLESIAYKILNREDLTPVLNVSTSEPFSKRYKKDLSKVSADLSELVMIDDTEHFVLNEKQEAHVVYLGKTYDYFDTFEKAKLSAGEYVPTTESEWSFARKKMLILAGAFHEALKDAENEGLTFSQAVELQVKNLNLSSSDWNEYSYRMYKMALAINSHHQKRQSVSSKSCVQLISPLLAE